MSRIDSEEEANRTQFLYHNFFRSAEENLVPEVSQIKRSGLWSPVNYSTISPDIFFFGGGVPEVVTVICATPHQRSNESVGEQHPWKRVRLMEPEGNVYSFEDDAVPASVKKFFIEQPNTEDLAKKGFRHIPPQDLKAIIEWGNEGRMFRHECNEALHQYTWGQTIELEAVYAIISLSLDIPMAMEILDPNFSRQGVVAGIAKSVTRLSLIERSEEILQAIADLETGNVERVNDYLASYYEDLDSFASGLAGEKDAIIQDETELSRRIGQRINRVMAIRPSYPDTRRILEEYRTKICK